MVTLYFILYALRAHSAAYLSLSGRRVNPWYSTPQYRSLPNPCPFSHGACDH